MIFFGERPFRRAVPGFVVHYHAERAYQGPGSERVEQRGAGRVQRTERLGGILKHYLRAA